MNASNLNVDISIKVFETSVLEDIAKVKKPYGKADAILDVLAGETLGLQRKNKELAKKWGWKKSTVALLRDFVFAYTDEHGAFHPEPGTILVMVPEGQGNQYPKFDVDFHHAKVREVVEEEGKKDPLVRMLSAITDALVN